MDMDMEKRAWKDAEETQLPEDFHGRDGKRLRLRRDSKYVEGLD